MGRLNNCHSRQRRHQVETLAGTGQEKAAAADLHQQERPFGVQIMGVQNLNEGRMAPTRQARLFCPLLDEKENPQDAAEDHSNFQQLRPE